VGLAGMKADRAEKTKGLFFLLWVLRRWSWAGFLMVKAPLLLAKGLFGRQRLEQRKSG